MAWDLYWHLGFLWCWQESLKGLKKQEICSSHAVSIIQELNSWEERGLTVWSLCLVVSFTQCNVGAKCYQLRMVLALHWGEWLHKMQAMVNQGPGLMLHPAPIELGGNAPKGFRRSKVISLVLFWSHDAPVGIKKTQTWLINTNTHKRPNLAPWNTNNRLCSQL